MILVSHPSGNANVRQVLQALEEKNLLCEYATFFATIRGNFFDFLAQVPAFAEFERRRLPSKFGSKCVQRPWPELGRLLAQSLSLKSLLQHESGLFCPDRNNMRLGELASSRLRHGKQIIRGVYCYEDAALEAFRAASDLGFKKIYDLPIGYWRAAQEILAEEADRRPEWRVTMGGLNDSKQKLDRKDKELQLTDHIIVASTFTKATLAKCPFSIASVSVIPYGADGESSLVPRPALPHQGRPLKLLFVGGISQRKGIADLFEAVEIVGSGVELTVIGRRPPVACAALDSSLCKHRWIESLPRARILQEMRGHDVLVFPSLFEGFGLVVTEALSQGLPVITTPNTCGPDVITDGSDGFIVPIRDPQAIAEKVELLHRDRERLSAMSDAARIKAESLAWESYRQSVVAVVREVLA